MPKGILKESTIAILGTLVLGTVVVVAGIAAHKTTPLSEVSVEELPVTSYVDPSEPTAEDCLASGGEIRYDRTSECFSEPNVRDVCGFGVPCFDGGSGYRCIDVKNPYCACETNEDCPEEFVCDSIYTPDRCSRVYDQQVPPKPLMTR